MNTLAEVIAKCRENGLDNPDARIESERSVEQRRRDDDRRKHLRKQSQIPQRFVGARLVDLQSTKSTEPVINAAASVAGGGFVGSLGIYGRDVGTGKTTIAAAVCNAAIEALIPARMLTVVSLVEQLHEASKFGSDDDTTRIIDDFARTPVLLLDDLGREQMTRRSISWLYELLNRRWNACRPLLLTTNLSFEGLLERYSAACARAGEPDSTADAIVDRLRGLVPLESWFELRGKSRRGAAA